MACGSCGGKNTQVKKWSYTETNGTVHANLTEVQARAMKVNRKGGTVAPQ